MDTTDNIQINGTEKENVTKYKYLGQTIAVENITKQKPRSECKQDGVFLESTGKSFWTGTFP